MNHRQQHHTFYRPVYHTRTPNPEASKSPFDRAWDRWDAAYARGGLTGAITATRTRIDSTKDYYKLLGILQMLNTLQAKYKDRRIDQLIDQVARKAGI
jgi:hypothetical protein